MILATYIPTIVTIRIISRFQSISWFVEFHLMCFLHTGTIREQSPKRLARKKKVHAQMRREMKALMFLTPTQLFRRLQWWSYPLTQLLHTLQWDAFGFLLIWQVVQSLSLYSSVLTKMSLAVYPFLLILFFLSALVRAAWLMIYSCCIYLFNCWI